MIISLERYTLKSVSEKTMNCVLLSLILLKKNWVVVAGVGGRGWGNVERYLLCLWWSSFIRLTMFYVLLNECIARGSYGTWFRRDTQLTVNVCKLQILGTLVHYKLHKSKCLRNWLYSDIHKILWTENKG